LRQKRGFRTFVAAFVAAFVETFVEKTSPTKIAPK
jgi:hypothetical protein